MARIEAELAPDSFQMLVAFLKVSHFMFVDAGTAKSTEALFRQPELQTNKDWPHGGRFFSFFQCSNFMK